MIKKFLVYTICALFSLCASAQVVKGSFTGLTSQRIVLVEVDYDRATIHGMSEEDFGYYEEDWTKDKADIIENMIEEFEDKVERHVTILSKYRRPIYKIIIHVVNVDSRGNHVCNIDIVDPHGILEATIDDLYASGGNIGSKLNLINDGAKHIGTKLGKFLRNEFRKARKQYY